MEGPSGWFIGEALEDRISATPGAEFNQVTRWDPHFGGAPANTAVALAQLGVPTGLLGCVGNDELGTSLREELVRRGVDTSGLMTVERPTRIAYVLLDADGDRKFDHFQGDADEHHAPFHLPESYPGTGQILHFGSISLRPGKTAEQTTRNAITQAILKGMIVSCDTNYRDVLWDSVEAFRHCVLGILGNVDVLKVSDGELRILADDQTVAINSLAEQFRQRHRLPLLLVTLDSKGCIAVSQSAGTLNQAAYPVIAVDPTGAGDAFDAGILYGLYCLLNQGGDACARRPREVVQTLSPGPLMDIVSRACALGALACTKPGAWSALPTEEELYLFLQERGG